MRVELEMLLRVAVAAIFGAAVGYDRERHDKPAGLRTHMLVASGAALFVASGGLILAAADPGAPPPDLLRVTSAIVAGIGFLGAGAIITSGGNVRGLTTAAGIWVTAGIGSAVGAGQYLLGLGATVITLIVVAMISPGMVDATDEDN